MQTMEPTELGNALQRMWEPNRESLRRLLISLTRDIDLADDLLQETYLHARSGLPSYRGGDARAWLAAIAKNAFYAHARRSSTRLETALLPDEEVGAEANTGSTSYLSLLELRQAVSDLSPTLRTALIMKHYGGFTYLEIAERLGCPVGTAKWRVREAIGKLRAVLGAEEEAGMKCADLMGTSVLDYLYGIPKDAEREKIKRHIDKCDACRSVVADLRKVTTGLDALEGDHKMMHIIELNEEGQGTLYTSTSLLHVGEGPIETDTFFTNNSAPLLDYVAVFGEEVPFEVAEHTPTEEMKTYTIRLPRPIFPGERIDMLMVWYASPRGLTAQRLEDGRWHVRHRQTCADDAEFLFIHTMRLPVGASFCGSTLEPDEHRTDGTTTLTWRRVLAPNEAFDCELFYTLPDQG